MAEKRLAIQRVENCPWKEEKGHWMWKRLLLTVWRFTFGVPGDTYCFMPMSSINKMDLVEKLRKELKALEAEE